jgi:predicted nucleic acid-binding protein
MIVVSDTSPLNYLILIGEEELLPAFFSRVIVPPAVIEELSHSHAPDAVSLWLSNPPKWLENAKPNDPISQRGLGPGESEAIALALEFRADVVLIDERQAAGYARSMNLQVTGTLGILELASQRGLIDLPSAVEKLRLTNFRCSAELLNALLQRDAARRGT